MKKVFIGGSRRISRLNEVIRKRLDAIIRGELMVLVGDANGADKAARSFFAERGYRNVTVYHAGSACRNNVAGWEAKSIRPPSRTRDFSFYAAKDLAMSEDADFGFMLWDGKSRGTLVNVLNLLDRRKRVVIYFAPDERCHSVPDRPQLASLLKRCDPECLALLERKVDLGLQNIPGQQTLALA